LSFIYCIFFLRKAVKSRQCRREQAALQAHIVAPGRIGDLHVFTVGVDARAGGKLLKDAAKPV
jgi:hypothetical protein